MKSTILLTFLLTCGLLSISLQHLTPTGSPEKFTEEFRLRSINYPTHFVNLRDGLFFIQNNGNVTSFRILPGLSGAGVSLESVEQKGYFLRHQNFRVKLHPFKEEQLYRNDATFFMVRGFRGDTVSFESKNYQKYFIRHRNFELWLDPLDQHELYFNDASFFLENAKRSPLSNTLSMNGLYSFDSVNYPTHKITLQNDLLNIDEKNIPMIFRVVPGLSGVGISLENERRPGHYLRHQNFRVKVHRFEPNQLFLDDATFFVRDGLTGREQGAVTFESKNYPQYYIRHYDFQLKLNKHDGSELFSKDASFVPRSVSFIDNNN